MPQPPGDDATFLGEESPGSLDGSCPQAPAGPTPAPTRRIGDYEIEGDLGRGAMGVVYRARNSSGRLVAIKVLRGEPSVTATQRFLREAEVLAQLKHPAVVRVHDRGSDGGELYMVMALVEGKSLEELLEEEHLLEPERAIRLAAVVARALEATHAKGVIHRDIKPDNIRLNAEGDPVLVDFGLAGSQGAHSLTQDGQLLGTPYYMPPEQATGDLKSIGPASDVYSLGATLYRLVTGQPPFAGRTQTALLKSIAERRPASVAALRPGLSASLSAVIDRCLEKDPAARYPSAAALADALERVLAGNETPTASRAPRLALLVALVVALVVAVAALTMPGSRHDLDGEPSPAEVHHAQGPLPAPILTAPPPHAALPLGGDVELRWMPVATATGYEVETARGDPLQSTTTSQIVSSTQVVPGSWRVRAVGPDGPGEWSAASPLEVSDIPGWLWPPDGAVLKLGKRGELRWTPVPGASGYELLKDDFALGMPSATTSHSFEAAPQFAGQESTFRVRAVFGDRRGPLSLPLHFRFATWRLPGAVEAEDARVLRVNSASPFVRKAGLVGELSGGCVGWFESPAPDDWVELLIPLESAGRYRVSVQLYRGFGCGQVRLGLGDLSVVLDGLLPENPITNHEGVRVLLGETNLSPSASGGVPLRLTVVGKAEASTGFSFGLDCVLLEPL